RPHARRSCGLSGRRPVDGDVAGGDAVVERHVEGFAFGFADGDKGFAILFLKLPVIVAGRLRLVVARGLRFAAQAIEPRLVFELERIGGILALVHLRQIFFGQAEIFERDLARVGVQVYFHFLIAAHAQGHAPLHVRAGHFEPMARAGLVVGGAIGREVQVFEVFPHTGDGNYIPGAGIGHLQVGQVFSRRRIFPEEGHRGYFWPPAGNSFGSCGAFWPRSAFSAASCASTLCPPSCANCASRSSSLPADASWSKALAVASSLATDCSNLLSWANALSALPTPAMASDTLRCAIAAFLRATRVVAVRSPSSILRLSSPTCCFSFSLVCCAA